MTEKINVFIGGKPADPLPVRVERGRCVCRGWGMRALSDVGVNAPTLRLSRNDQVFLKAVGIALDECELMNAGEEKPMNEREIEIRKTVDALVAEQWATPGFKTAAALAADPSLREATSAALEAELAAQKRKGTPGEWCFYCGRLGQVVRCDCASGDGFGCGEPLRYVCPECVSAHKVVAEHLRKMFSFPLVMRSNSRRGQAERELFGAANTVCDPNESDDYDSCAKRDLVFFIAQADAFYHGKSEFRRLILDAFRHSKFLDFQALAKALEKEKEAAFIRALYRAVVARPRGKSCSGVGMSSESKRFYR